MSSTSAALQTALSLLANMGAPHSTPQKQPPNPPPSTLATITNAFRQTAPMSVPNPAPSVTSSRVAGAQASTPPSTSKSSSCDECHLRPKYFDGTKLHPFCSKSCAAAAKGAIGNTQTNNGHSTAGPCDFCGRRPKYLDGSRLHNFCSKACANNFKSKGTPQKKGSVNIQGTCTAPGCTKLALIPSNGGKAEYCSTAHKTLVETICLMCKRAAKQNDSHFCSKMCLDQAEKTAPVILEVPIGHVTFTSVADQFKASWRHVGSTCPAVRKVYKIMSTSSSLDKYNAYRDSVELRGQFVASGRSAGNENRRWHGTHRCCNIGDSGKPQLCSSSTCSLCCIIRTSFDLTQFGKKTGWGRFGKGLYTSSTSSKSNDYSRNDCVSNLKAILLNKVVVGKGFKMTHDDSSLTGPPSGYDSVLAEKGGSLNYDELVVYRNDAIRPSFLVMYDA